MGGPTFLRAALAVGQYRATICSRQGSYFIMFSRGLVRKARHAALHSASRGA